MSKDQLLLVWGAVVTAAAAFAAKYGELSKRKRRKMLLGLIVFVLIFSIPAVLLYLAPDEWFANEAALPINDPILPDPSPTVPLPVSPSPDQWIRKR